MSSYHYGKDLLTEACDKELFCLWAGGIFPYMDLNRFEGKFRELPFPSNFPQNSVLGSIPWFQQMQMWHMLGEFISRSDKGCLAVPILQLVPFEHLVENFRPLRGHLLGYCKFWSSFWTWVWLISFNYFQLICHFIFFNWWIFNRFK